MNLIYAWRNEPEKGLRIHDVRGNALNVILCSEVSLIYCSLSYKLILNKDDVTNHCTKSSRTPFKFACITGNDEKKLLSLFIASMIVQCEFYHI